MDKPTDYDYYIVLDFEANCSSSQARDHEIIEFPAQLVDAKTGVVISTFREFVKPSHIPILSDFIKGLCGIAQKDIDAASPFSEVLARFMTWVGDKRVIFVTCGHWDLGTMMPQQCKVSNVDVPALFKYWINLKIEFDEHMREPSKKKRSQLGMAEMLQHLGLTLEGRHHSGIDDVKNITRILQYMMQRGKMSSPKIFS